MPGIAPRGPVNKPVVGQSLHHIWTSLHAEWRNRVVAVVVAGIAVMQWLAGGTGAPYDRLLLLPVVYVAVLHPPRQIDAISAKLSFQLYSFCASAMSWKP